jgi:hypothetical protein
MAASTLGTTSLVSISPAQKMSVRNCAGETSDSSRSTERVEPEHGRAFTGYPATMSTAQYNC